MFLVLTSLGNATLILILFKPGTWISAALLLLLLSFVGAAVDATVVAQHAERPFQLRPYNRWYVYIGVIVGIWAVGLFRPNVLEWLRISSGSMSPTLLLGDWIYVDKRTEARQTLRRQDLLVYRSPDDNTTVIKRIVGVAGDTLLMRSDTLLRNGMPVTEPYVDWNRMVAARPGTMEFGNWGPIVVPRESVFVLGDERHASKDSRHVGFIPAVNSVGKPLVIYYSYDLEADTPLPFLTAIRWHRLGTKPL